MAKKPNILFILSDDQGAWAMHCSGNADIQTPSLDALASRGTRFDDFFCVSPVCSPARASIFTGTIPSVHGVQDWIHGGNVTLSEHKILQGNPKFAHEQEAIRYLDGMTTFVDVLHDAGYRCALSGKWHLGDSVHPQHGFERWFTIARGGCPYYQADLIRNGEIFYDGRYVTDSITDDAIANIEDYAKEDEPFYLSIHYTAPHSPWTAKNHPKEYLNLYKDCPFDSLPRLPLHPWLSPASPYKQGEEGRLENLRGYFAAITAMDAGIGRILEKLEELHLAQDTIVIFTSDNGMNMGHHGIWGKGNGTFPQNMYDSSVKIPFILSWPGHVDQGKVNRELFSHYDIFPTLIDLLSLPVPEDCQKLPGSSFASLFKQGAENVTSNRPVVVFDEYGPVRMIRTKNFKYVMRIPYGPDELYSLKEDPDETTNLFEDAMYANVRKELRSELTSWFANYVDPKRDASHECNTGYGQLCKVGVESKGLQVFVEEKEYRECVSHMVDTLVKPKDLQP
jgi:arylsulfatase A-like enzyme